MGGEAQQGEEQGFVVNCDKCGAAVILPLNWKAAEAECPECQGRMAISPDTLARLADLRREARKAGRQKAREQRAPKKRQRREAEEARREGEKARRREAEEAEKEAEKARRREGEEAQKEPKKARRREGAEQPAMWLGHSRPASSVGSTLFLIVALLVGTGALLHSCTTMVDWEDTGGYTYEHDLSVQNTVFQQQAVQLKWLYKRQGTLSAQLYSIMAWLAAIFLLFLAYFTYVMERH